MSLHTRINSGADPWDPDDDGRVAPSLSAMLARVERAMHEAGVDRLEGPPPEVQREMVTAERARQSLAAEGREVRFGTGEDGRVSIELTDRAGRALDTIGVAGLFELLNLV
jgi:hypothetical protein